MHYQAIHDVHTTIITRIDFLFVYTGHRDRVHIFKAAAVWYSLTDEELDEIMVCGSILMPLKSYIDGVFRAAMLLWKFVD
jgi:hypothetical protein